MDREAENKPEEDYRRGGDGMAPNDNCQLLPQQRGVGAVPDGDSAGAAVKAVSRTELCHVCSNKTHGSLLYTCPRCNIRYCSVGCYRSPSHSQCSEAFYKQCIDKELVTREQQKGGNAVIEQLQRLERDDFEVDPIPPSTLGEDSGEERRATEELQQQLRSLFENDGLEGVDETELDRQLMELGIGTDVSSLLNALSDNEKVSFNSLAADWAATAESADDGESDSVFRRRKK